MTVEQAILENVKALSPDQQQEVLAFIKFLQSERSRNEVLRVISGYRDLEYLFSE